MLGSHHHGGSICRRHFSGKVFDLTKVARRREISFLGSDELDTELNHAHTGGLGELLLERVPHVLGCLGGDDIAKDLLRHGGEEATEDLLVLVVPGRVSRVDQKLGADDRRCGDLLFWCRDGAIKVARQIGAP
jgi:hypothetical protein